jgi:hypothetical protein
VSFAALPDKAERDYLNQQPTTFVLSAEAVDRLRAAAGTIIQASPEFQRLLKDVGARVLADPAGGSGRPGPLTNCRTGKERATAIAPATARGCAVAQGVSPTTPFADKMNTTMKRVLLPALMAAALGASVAQGKECKGVNFPDQAQVEGTNLTLNGLGLRQATAFKVNVYVAALYVVKTSSDAAALLGSNVRAN